MPAHACTDPVQHFRTQHRDTSYVKHTPPRQQQQQQRQQQTFTARWMYRSTPTQHIRTAQLYSSISRRQHLVQTAAVLPVPLLTAGRPAYINVAAYRPLRYFRFRTRYFSCLWSLWRSRN